MFRTLIGLAIGFVLGILFLGGWGMYDGVTTGLPTAQLPPGLEAGAKSAFVYIMYLFPFAAIIGGGIGAIAGFGSWLVRPRKEKLSTVGEVAV